MTPEGKVKKDIKAFLDGMSPRVRYFMTQNMGMGESGVADIVGVIDGRAFAIEVKRADGGGSGLSPWQLRFLQSWKAAGGLAFVARNVQDVIEGLELK